MPKVELQDFYDQINNLKDPQSAPSIVTIFGNDDYLHREMFLLLKKNMQPENPDFNWTQIEIDKVELDDIILEYKSYPMFSDFRVIVLEIKDFSQEAKLKKIIAFLLDQSESTTKIILRFFEWDGKKSYLQSLLEKGLTVECRTPYSNQISQWIYQIADRYLVEFDPEALSLFHKRVGDRLSLIDLEIQKLKSVIGSRKTIMEADVLSAIPIQGEASIFEWIECFFSRDLIATEEKLSNIKQSGESPLACISLMARHCRLVLKCHEGFKLGLRGHKLSQYLRVANYFLKKYEQDLRLWKASEVEKLLVNLNQIDIQIKSSRLKPFSLLSHWTHQSLK